MGEHADPSPDSFPTGHKRRLFSPLIGRVLAVNVIALAILGGGILYLDQFRENLIATRLENLEAEAQIIAGAIGESAGGGPETQAIDIDLAQQIIARLTGPTGTRARLFLTGGELVADSRILNIETAVQVAELPPPNPTFNLGRDILAWINERLDAFAYDPSLSDYTERPDQTATDYQEVEVALQGDLATHMRHFEEGTVMLTVAVPVQRFRRVLGALLLSTDTGDIQNIIYAERMTILKVFGLSVVVTLFLSFFLASTIARPIQRLARAADQVAGGIGRASALPGYPNRRDEIGDLAQSLKDMTRALYRQLDAVERFAADVAHEIKNPLSSIRSAVETLQRSDDPDVRVKLLGIIQDDIRRLDRLISDISSASRLDAELARSEMHSIDLKSMLEMLIDSRRATGTAAKVSIEFTCDADSVMVQGLEHQLGQVFRNLIDNAVSFSPAGGVVRVALAKGDKFASITVDDEGPGLPAGAADRIFERFYSERPANEEFGTHSGLGLSISKQIVEAHGGQIIAENRVASDGVEEEGELAGARFIVRLPC